MATEKAETRESRTPADKRAEEKRKIEAARRAALAVPQNLRVIAELAKR